MARTSDGFDKQFKNFITIFSDLSETNNHPRLLELIETDLIVERCIDLTRRKELLGNQRLIWRILRDLLCSGSREIEKQLLDRDILSTLVGPSSEDAMDAMEGTGVGVGLASSDSVIVSHALDGLQALAFHVGESAYVEDCFMRVFPTIAHRAFDSLAVRTHTGTTKYANLIQSLIERFPSTCGWHLLEGDHEFFNMMMASYNLTNFISNTSRLECLLILANHITPASIVIRNLEKRNFRQWSVDQIRQWPFRDQNAVILRCVQAFSDDPEWRSRWFAMPEFVTCIITLLGERRALGDLLSITVEVTSLMVQESSEVRRSLIDRGVIDVLLSRLPDCNSSLQTHSAMLRILKSCCDDPEGKVRFHELNGLAEVRRHLQRHERLQLEFKEWNRHVVSCHCACS
jgi:hypothetical protein